MPVWENRLTAVTSSAETGIRTWWDEQGRMVSSLGFQESINLPLSKDPLGLIIRILHKASTTHSQRTAKSLRAIKDFF